LNENKEVTLAECNFTWCTFTCNFTRNGFFFLFLLFNAKKKDTLQ